MKKIILLFSIFLLSVTAVFALSTPRWNHRPIKVYIPGTTYNSQIMKNILYIICHRFISFVII